MESPEWDNILVSRAYEDDIFEGVIHLLRKQSFPKN